MANVKTSDHDIGRLMGGLKQIDNNLSKLSKAGMFEKAQIAEDTIKETRTLLGHMVITIHSIKNDLHRLNTEEA